MSAYLSIEMIEDRIYQNAQTTSHSRKDWILYYPRHFTTESIQKNYFGNRWEVLLDVDEKLKNLDNPFRLIEDLFESAILLYEDIEDFLTIDLIIEYMWENFGDTTDPNTIFIYSAE